MGFLLWGKLRNTTCDGFPLLVAIENARFDNLRSNSIKFVRGIFQHEYDHLEGILFLDRLASPADLYSEEEYQKISNIAEYKR